MLGANTDKRSVRVSEGGGARRVVLRRQDKACILYSNKVSSNVAS